MVCLQFPFVVLCVQVSPDMYGDNNPRLFTYWTVGLCLCFLTKFHNLELYLLAEFFKNDNDFSLVWPGDFFMYYGMVKPLCVMLGKVPASRLAGWLLTQHNGQGQDH
jgi:hypothetical protein